MYDSDRSVMDRVNETMATAERMCLLPMVLIAVSEEGPSTIAVLPFFDTAKFGKDAVKKMLTEALKCCE